MCAPSQQREFGTYGKYIKREVRCTSDEENNPLKVFGENFPQRRIELPARGTIHNLSSLSWLWELLV